MSRLSEITNGDAVNPGRPCSFAENLEALRADDPDLAGDIDRWLAGDRAYSGYTYGAIYRAMVAAGHSPARSSVGHHFRQNCRCY